MTLLDYLCACLVFAPMVLLGVMGVTAWTPFPKPKNWQHPGSPNDLASEEGRQYRRRRDRFWMTMFACVAGFYLLLAVVNC